MSEYDWFWFCTIKGLYDRQRRILLEFFGSPQEIRRAKKEELEKIPFLGIRKAEEILKHRQNFDPEEEMHRYEKQGIHFISRENKRYPEKLQCLYDRPQGLFYIGEFPKESEKCVAVIGARMCTAYGKKLAQELSERLAENEIPVVSGMAYGIDACAQKSCIDAGGKSYAVLGSGVDICYPPENKGLYQKLRTHGGIISEYPPGTPVRSYHFPMRNRLISALAEQVVVVEARKKSGTLITADFALEQGKDVYAFPGRMEDVLSAGCNELIRQGAGVIVSIEDFLKEIGCLSIKNVKKKKCKIVLASSEELVYSCLDLQSKHLEEVIRAVNMPVGQVLSALGTLQLKGLVTESAKNYYAKVREYLMEDS